MVWFVQPLQKRNKDGTPAGIWHLCAESDEGGGFYPCCDHDHQSAEEASDCEEARKAADSITGMPRMR